MLQYSNHVPVERVIPVEQVGTRSRSAIEWSWRIPNPVRLQPSGTGMLGLLHVKLGLQIE